MPGRSALRQFAQMQQVGEAALAIRAGEQACDDAFRRRGIRGTSGRNRGRPRCLDSRQSGPRARKVHLVVRRGGDRSRVAAHDLGRKGCAQEVQREGSSNARSRHSKSAASGAWKTLACASSTLPTSSAASARLTRLPSPCVRTRTAMSSGRNGLPSTVITPPALSRSNRAISAAVATLAASRAGVRLRAARPKRRAAASRAAARRAGARHRRAPRASGHRAAPESSRVLRARTPARWRRRSC